MIRYQDYALLETTHTPENIEWSISYSFNARDTETPRVLLIGDSICNAYQSTVREGLGKYANVTFWASSKCVTDPDYLRELDYMLDSYWYDAICFNNGLHSLTASPDEWEEAYANTVRFISDKCKGIPLFLTLCTPVADRDKNSIVMRINESISAFAHKKGLPIIDLYTPMAALNKRENMNDTFHWKAPAVAMQGERICRALKPIVAPELVPDLEEEIAVSAEDAKDTVIE
ncbi:MAG: SGNH/GDSL hydrolase family protein [Clostridia bacterium]|nr:SGNH/GDSL hydrolase family protein [Clostridia bacterium]